MMRFAEPEFQDTGGRFGQRVPGSSNCIGAHVPTTKQNDTQIKTILGSCRCKEQWKDKQGRMKREFKAVDLTKKLSRYK